MLPGSYYLLSHHNIILYVDNESKRVRHAPFGTARLNVVLELASGGGQLRVIGRSPSEWLRVSLEREGDEIRIQAGDDDLDGAIRRLPDGLVGIRIGEFYASADFDGVVRSNRFWCREWERYRLVGADAVRQRDAGVLVPRQTPGGIPAGRVRSKHAVGSGPGGPFNEGLEHACCQK